MEKLTKAELDYLIKLMESDASIDWNKAVVDLDANLHPDSLRKSFNVGRYCGYNVAKYYQDLIESEYFTDEEFLRLESLRDEVYKEKCKLQDERRLKNKDLREESRFENLVDALKENMEFLPEMKLNICEKEIKNGLSATMMISDIHLGIKVDNTIRYFDVDTLKEQFSTLTSKLIKYCRLHSVSELHIPIIGDVISGIIQINNRIDEEEDSMSQIVIVSEILSQFINEVKKEIPKVKLYGVIGNHSSVFANKKERSNKENFERLVFEFIKLRTGEKVITNGHEDYLTYKVGNREILATHGNRDSLDNIKKHFVDLLGRTFDEYILGHIHHFNIKEDCLSEIISNGSWVGTDDYAVSIRKNTPPSQTLRIYDEDIATYKLTLN